jgi:hypothetical protein
MANKGFSHIGLSTLDLDKPLSSTRTYSAFRIVRFDEIPIEGGVASATPSWMPAATS